MAAPNRYQALFEVLGLRLSSPFSLSLSGWPTDGLRPRYVLITLIFSLAMLLASCVYGAYWEHLSRIDSISARVSIFPITTTSLPMSHHSHEAIGIGK